MQPNKEKVSELLKHQVVAEWINEKQADNLFGKRHPDCYSCGWPHAPNILCGSGATFGTLTIGGLRYGIDASNVEYMLSFMMDGLSGLGFHWKNQIFFDVRDDVVAVTYFQQYNNCPNKRTWKIPLREWQSIVDFIAAKAAPKSPALDPATVEAEAARDAKLVSAFRAGKESAALDPVTVETLRLVRMVRALLRYTNPCNVPEDHSQQWQAVHHQCDVIDNAEAASNPVSSTVQTCKPVAWLVKGGNAFTRIQEVAEEWQLMGIDLETVFAAISPLPAHQVMEDFIRKASFASGLTDTDFTETPFTRAAVLDLKRAAQACCEWDQPKDTCRCRDLAIDDPARCQSPIGVARAFLAAFAPDPVSQTAPALDMKGAHAAAEALFDYADNNLSMFEACTEDEPVKAREIFEVTKKLRDLLVPPESQTHTAVKCSECDRDWADLPSKLCPGCQAYREHQR